MQNPVQLYLVLQDTVTLGPFWPSLLVNDWMIKKMEKSYPSQTVKPRQANLYVICHESYPDLQSPEKGCPAYISERFSLRTAIHQAGPGCRQQVVSKKILVEGHLDNHSPPPPPPGGGPFGAVKLWL